MATDEQRRRLTQQRVEAFRDRRKHGRLLVAIEVDQPQLAAFERLGLLDVGERSKSSVAAAVMQFLNAAASVAAIGDALWPMDDEGLVA